MSGKLLLSTAVILLIFTASATSQVSNHTGKRGDAISMTCGDDVTEETTVFSVIWRHNGNDIARVGPRGTEHATPDIIGKYYKRKAEVNPLSYELSLRHLGLADEGDFECDVVGPTGQSTYQHQLNVKAVPEATTKVISVIDDGTNSTKLEVARCKATGASKPYKIWWESAEGDEVARNNEKVEMKTDEGLYDASLPLAIYPDSSRNNARVFTCFVRDAFQQIQRVDAVLSITVATTTVATTTPKASPTILRFPASDDDGTVTMTMEEIRNFQCIATGVPIPQVAWYKNNQPLLEEETGSSKLTIEATSYDQAGNYSCVAENIAGHVTNWFQLNVYGFPKIQLEESANQTTHLLLNEQDEIVQLKCEAVSIPLPEMAWSSKDDVNTTTVKHQTIGDKRVESVAFIRANQFSTKGKKLTCIARNQLGFVTRHYVIRTPEKKLSTGGTGLIVGIIIAICLAAFVIIASVYLLVSRRRRPDLVDEGRSCGGIINCCAAPKHTKVEIDDATEEEVAVKEEKEEKEENGTREEKQKLTEAEEKPAAKDESIISEKSAVSDAGAEEREKKKRYHLPSITCCPGGRGRKELNEEEDVAQETGNDNGNVADGKQNVEAIIEEEENVQVPEQVDEKKEENS